MATEPRHGLPEIEDNWALVYSGSRIFIGQITSDFDVNDDWLNLYPVYEVTVQLIPTGRTPTGQPVMSKNISAEPVLLSFDGSELSVCATGISRFRHMRTGDRARYKKLVDSAKQMATDARAADAGIELPGRRNA